MKNCTNCGIAKGFDEFYYQSRAKNQLHAQCKECYKAHRKTYSAEHYKKYGDAYRARAKIRRMKIRRELQVNLINYLSNKSCAQCKEADIRVLEFDHINPKEKQFNIARAISDGLKWEVIEDEISRCQVLCANCHKKRTASQYNWFKSIGLE